MPALSVMKFVAWCNLHAWALMWKVKTMRCILSGNASFQVASTKKNSVRKKMLDQSLKKPAALAATTLGCYTSAPPWHGHGNQRLLPTNIDLHLRQPASSKPAEEIFKPVSRAVMTMRQTASAPHLQVLFTVYNSLTIN